MNKLLRISLFSIAAVLPLRAQAQLLCALGPASPPYEPMADMPPSAGAQGDLKKLKSLLCPKGCGKVLLFANATTPNTATVTDGAGGSKIAYSPGFVSGVQKTYGPAGTLGIFAHDLGHHLEATGNRPAWMKEAWDSELRADAWAGCAMAKAELTPSRLQAALLALSSYPSGRHPDWSVRRPVITEGYTRCGGKLLPPLGKESPERAAKIDGRRDDAVSSAPGRGGCTSDRDCRNGRTCVNSRCGAAPEHRLCGKDTDCPEPQECGADGYCGGPASGGAVNQARAEEEPPKPAPGPMLASLQEPRPAPASASASPPASPPPPTAVAATVTVTSDAAACQRSCDDFRNQCVEAVNSETNKCLSSIRSDPGYKACQCPNYPAGNNGCYNLCTNAFEKGKSCAADNLVRDCRTDGDRCRTQCK
jgi:hypothetical protein